MKKTTTDQQPLNEWIQTAIIAAAKRGNIGKSTAMLAIADRLTEWGIAWGGVDADALKPDLGRTYPQTVATAKAKTEEDFMTAIRKLDVGNTVGLLDVAAESNRELLGVIGKGRVVEWFKTKAKASGKLAVLVFATSVPDDVEDASFAVELLGDTVNWIVVVNNADPGSPVPTTFKALHKQLESLGAGTMYIPTLMPKVRDHAQKVNAKHDLEHGRMLTMKELAEGEHLEFMAQGIYQSWREIVGDQIASVAHLFVPPHALAQVTKPIETKTEIKPRRSSVLDTDL